MWLLLRMLGLRAFAFLLLLGESSKLGVRADVNLVVLLPPLADEATSVSEGYFALTPALDTLVRLAGQHVNEDGSLLEGNVSLSVVHSDTAAEAAATLCSELVQNVNSSVAVSVLDFSMFRLFCTRYLVGTATERQQK